MSVYRITPQAADDLFEIWSFIARDSVEAAGRVEETILNSCALLADAPQLGQARDHLTQRPVRFWTVPRYPNYVIVYDPSPRPLQVIRILHGKRNLTGLLEM
jgi:plasmid stabilization system protein ParE